MSRSRWIDGALRAYPPWWRARYGDEVRAVSSDALEGGHSLLPIALGLLMGAVRTRVTGTGTPRQFLLWASRTRACVIATTVPALVVLPLFFLTFRQGQPDGVPLVRSALRTTSGHVAFNAFGVLAVAGLLAMGVVIRAYMVLVGATGQPAHRPKGGRRTGRVALAVVLWSGIVVATVTQGAVALFVLVALSFTGWGHVTVTRVLGQRGGHGRTLPRLVRIAGLMAGLAVVAWIGSGVLGAHRFLDSRGVDVPLDGHPSLAHWLVVGAATALTVSWVLTFASLILVVRSAPVAKEALRFGRIMGAAVSVLLWVMAGAATVSVLALERQGSPGHPVVGMVTTSWGHLWTGGAVCLCVGAVVATSGTVASWQSWSVAARLEP